MTSTFPHTTALKPSVTETEFLLTLSRQYQADKCGEQRKNKQLLNGVELDIICMNYQCQGLSCYKAVG